MCVWFFFRGKKCVSQFHVSIVISSAFKNHAGLNDFFFFLVSVYRISQLVRLKEKLFKILLFYISNKQVNSVWIYL